MSRKSTAIWALAAGLVYTVAYGAFEIHHFGVPTRLSLFGATDTLSVFHYPLIWLLSSVMFFGVLHVVRAVRGRSVRGHRAAYGLSVVLGVVVSVSVLVFYTVPQIGSLTVPVDPPNPCHAPTRPATNPVLVRYAKNAGFCPVRVTVPAGATITFVDDDGDSMRIDSDDPGLTQQDSASTFSTTLTKPGTFLYTDSPSTGSSLHKLVSELLGRTQTHQGVVTVVAPR